ncbi:MAG: response regulator transcription factor [Anaerolineae bacterium]|nr:response regulator transcription factor [Ardenticatenia bacterium]MBK8541549.1 response regulator transcription factor [Ardenticatenia bacterium]HQZ70570.1 response regulator transcription factor [Anaerolineae bacterium]HRA20173.1 response regulator transcription factor [Anaerolineae bacterium]
MSTSPLKDRLVLVVDDEPRIIRFVQLHFEMMGARVIGAADGRAGLEALRQHLPDLIILDVNMPGGLDGFETLRELRKVSEVPVIMLTVQADEPDRIRGLDLGADDYLAKPFSPAELVSRAQAVLRRTSRPTAAGQLVKVDEDLTIDFATREVIARGQRLKLRPTEWRLLYHLVQNAGWLLTHDIILSKVWGPEYLGQDNYVRLYVTYLRQKIEPQPGHPKYILTDRGVGYRFVDFAGKEQVPKDAG